MKTTWLPLVSLIFLGTYAGAQDQQIAQPNAPIPTETPPPPPEQPPPPPEQIDNSQIVASAPQSSSEGQWVYTTQYGWVWIPYGSQYTYEPSFEGAYPYAYIYYPAYG